MFKATLARVRRYFQHAKRTDKLSVWTRDNVGRVFHYDIRIAKTRFPGRFLVRFERVGSQGNSMRAHHRMTAAQVSELRMRSC